MGTIYYLKQEEKIRTRRMYEAIFSEDSRLFIDYYYDWKIRDNQIVVMESAEKGIEVMMHLNPYSLSWNGEIFTSEYIVAVATRPDCRKQGKMQQVMEQVLRNQQKKHMPFTFLIPADPAYYRGQGFVFAPGQPKEEQHSEEELPELTFIRAGIGDVGHLAETANAILKEHYELFVLRSPEYYQRLLAEVSSVHGAVLLIKKNTQTIGILAYGKEEGITEIKEKVLAGAWREKGTTICNQAFGVQAWAEESMRIMVRITDLKALSGMLKSRKSVCWKLRVTDDMVKANAGCWEIKKNPEGGSIRAIADSETEQELDIRELTEKILEDVPVFIREWV